jgi:transitional endoplasmic reticulum ATPase
MSQEFHLTRFSEFREKGIAAYRAARWKDARYLLLKASEHLFQLAKESGGRLREARIENAKKLSEMAKRIDPDAPPSGAPPAGAAGKARLAEERGEEGTRFRKVERPSVRFADIAGLDEVKEQVRLKMIYPFLHEDKARRYGIRPGGGILLWGPPGTGKTLIARAIAGELEAAFFAVKPSEILSKWVGESEGNIAALFRTARENPLSIVFFDEIEALVPKRRDSQSTVMQRVVPQILSELEGFDSAGKNPILFLGATNEPWSLDPAVLRPGRFDERIYVPLPDHAARRQMLGMYLRGRPVAPDLDFDALAARLEGYSGADIRNICNKAAAEAFLVSIEAPEAGERPIDAPLLDRILAATRPSVKPEDLARFEKYALVT